VAFTIHAYSMHVPDSGIENVHMFWNMCEYSMPLQNATYRDVMMDVINHYLRFQDSKETCLTRIHVYVLAFGTARNLILIAFITANSSLEPLIEGLCAQIHVNLR